MKMMNEKRCSHRWPSSSLLSAPMPATCISTLSHYYSLYSIFLSNY